MTQAVVTPENLGTDFDIGGQVSDKINIVQATDTVAGKVRLAGTADIAVADTTTAVTPAALVAVKNSIPVVPAAGVVTSDGTHLGSITAGATGQVLTVTGGGAQWQTPAGVSTFNGRTGVVAPVVGDYTADQVGAASMYALAENGIQINGGMDISQENEASVTNVTSGKKYIIDQWFVETSGFGVNASQITSTRPGYASALSVVSTVVKAPAATEFINIVQPVEGYRTGKLAFGTGVPVGITICFWVMTAIAGTYSGSVRNGSLTRSYPFSFAVSQANVWEFKVVSIAGDTTGSWAADNTVGMYVSFCLVAGSSLTGPANVWSSGTFYGVTATTNGAGVASGYMRITGVAVLPGYHSITQADAPLLMRSYDRELPSCLRYYELGEYITVVAGFGPAKMWVVHKRVPPTLSAFFDAGSGAIFAPIGIGGGVERGCRSFFQTTPHSGVNVALVLGDSRL